MSRVPATFAAESDDPNADHIVGHSPKMQDVYKAIGRVAIQDVNVLIVGESGTGKEMVARAILHHSRRSKGPFLAINCAALPETLLESEFLGMNGVPLPAPTNATSGNLNRLMAARSSWTRSVI